MRRREEALLAAVKLITGLSAGAIDATAVDIERFIKRPQGPHRHHCEVPRWPVPEEAKRGEYSGTHLVDFRALPDGTICWLFRDVDGELGVSWLHVRIGERSWDLGNQMTTCLGGKIVGANSKGEPIVEMHVRTLGRHGEQDCVDPTIYIGNTNEPDHRFAATRLPRYGWTMGADGRLYCLKWNRDRRACRLVGYDPLSMAQVYESGDFMHFGQRIESLAVRSPEEFLVVSDDGVRDDRMPNKRWPWYSAIVQGQDERKSRLHGAVVTLAGGYTYLLHPGGQPAHERSSHACIWTRLPAAEGNFDPRFRGHGSAEYVRGLTVLDEDSGQCAYVGKVAGGIGWVLPGKNGMQPGFNRVSDLFREGDEWRYWAFAEQQLYLMRLP